MNKITFLCTISANSQFHPRYIMTLQPASIGIVLNENQSQVLLVKLRSVPVWVLPGGGIEPGETPEIAVVREIEEESGCHVKIIKKCAEYTPINRLSAETHVFLCTITSMNIQPSEETTEIAFHSLDKLPSSFFHIHAKWLQECLANPRLIKRKLVEISYSALFKYFLRHPLQVLRHAWVRFITNFWSNK